MLKFFKLKIIPRLYNPLLARSYESTASHTSLPRMLKWKTNRPILVVTCNHKESQALLFFLDQDCHSKSVRSQISHDYWLLPIVPAGNRTRNCCLRGSGSASAQKRRIKLCFDSAALNKSILLLNVNISLSSWLSGNIVAFWQYGLDLFLVRHYFMEFTEKYSNQTIKWKKNL